MKRSALPAVVPAAKSAQVLPIESPPVSGPGSDKESERTKKQEEEKKQDEEKFVIDEENMKKMISAAGSLQKSLGIAKQKQAKATKARSPKVPHKKKRKSFLFFCQSCVSDSTDPLATNPPTNIPGETTKLPPPPAPITSIHAAETKEVDQAEQVDQKDTKQVGRADSSAFKVPDGTVQSIPDIEAFGNSKRSLLCTSSSSLKPSADIPPTPKTSLIDEDVLQERTTPPPPPPPPSSGAPQIEVVQAQALSGFSLNLSRLLERKGNARAFLLSHREKERVIRDMNTDFAETLVQQMDQTEATLLEAHLFAARRLVWQFWALDDTIQAKTRMPETTHEVIFGVLESFLYPRLAVLYDVQDYYELTPRDAALLVSWMDDFCRAAVEHAPGVELQEPWQRDCDRLAAFYLQKGVRQEVKAYLSRAFALRTEDDVREDGEGNLVTGLAEQVSYIIEQQLKVAREALPGKYRANVLSICNQEASFLVSDMQLKIGSDWRNISTSLYCAFINDANRLAEQCEERNEEFLGDSADEKLLEEANHLVKDLAELYLHASDYLCQRIMLNLCRPQDDILTSVGDAVWEQDKTSNAVETTIETLKDYFGDLEEWLVSDYYFVKVLKQCFQLVIRIYLESFFGNTLVRGVQSAETVAQELGKDYVRLVTFFNGEFFEKYRDEGSGGSFYTEAYINEELRILQHMAAIVLPENEPDFCRLDIAAILKRFPAEEGGAAILHLAGLRKRNIRGTESVSWVKAIASAKKSIAINDTTGESKEETKRSTKKKEANAVHVPDLRNSKFIQNIRPVLMSVLDRDISEGTMDYAQSTIRLLDTTNRNPGVIKHAKEGAAAFTRGIGAGLRFAMPERNSAGSEEKNNSPKKEDRNQTTHGKQI